MGTARMKDQETEEKGKQKRIMGISKVGTKEGSPHGLTPNAVSATRSNNFT